MTSIAGQFADVHLRVQGGHNKRHEKSGIIFKQEP